MKKLIANEFKTKQHNEYFEERNDKIFTKTKSPRKVGVGISRASGDACRK